MQPEHRAYRSFRAFLCQCSRCVCSQTFNPLTNVSVRGRYLGKKERDEHRRIEARDRNRSIASSSIPLSVPEPPPFSIPEPLPCDSMLYTSERHRENPPQENSITGQRAVGFCHHASHPTDDIPMQMDVDEEHPSPVLMNVDSSLSPDSALLKYLTDTKATLESRHAQFADHGPLVFVVPPTANCMPLVLQPPPEQPREINQGRFAITYSNLSNSPLLEHEEWLLSTYLQIELYKNHPIFHIKECSTILLEDLTAALLEVENWKTLEWENQRIIAVQSSELRSPPDIYSRKNMIATEKYLKPAFSQSHPILVVCYLLVAVLHLLCHISIQHCVFVLRSIRLILELSLTDQQPLTPEGREIASNIPSDVRTLLRNMDVLPVTRSFVCCKACFALYPLESATGYPDYCSAQSTAESLPCNAPLRIKRKLRGVVTAFPVRRYIYQDFKHWLGRLLCRPGFESILDRDILDSDEGGKRECGDIVDTETIQSLQGPDGRNFLKAGIDEGRYVFGLCMDGFQPHGRGGPPCSVGAIYLACMNLPPNLRYKADNLFLAGIIPGPTHPSMEEINPMLAPLVDDFLDLWHHGVYYTATPCHPSGKLCKSAIIPLICDILAARQAAGFAGHGHRYFCSFCLLNLSNIEDLNWQEWPMRSCDEHRSHAQRWRDARSIEERQQIYDEAGVRWSELLRLPYWNPIKYTALDPMHALFLNAFGTHIEKIWGVNMGVEGDLQGITFETSKRPLTSNEMQGAYVILRTGSNTSLEKLRVDVLRCLCKEQNLRFSGKKNLLLDRLQTLRLERGWVSEIGSWRMHDSMHVLSAEVQEQVTDAMKALERKAMSALLRFKRNILRHLCVHVFGGKFSDYEGLSKREIVERLNKYRLSHHIVDVCGELPHHGEDPNHSAAPNTEELSRGMEKFHEGSKTDLLRLPITVLVEICRQVINDVGALSLDSLNKTQLVQLLLRYRQDNGLGKAAVHKASHLTGPANTSLATGSAPNTGLAPNTQPLVGTSSQHVITQEELAKAEDVLERGSKTNLSALSTAALHALCRTYLNRTDYKDMNRATSLSLLHQFRVDRGITNEGGKLLADQRRASTKSRVLGRRILERIWSDMDEIILPSWVSRVPRRTGSSVNATGLGLGADEWRTFCSIHLTTTLIYLWGISPEHSREYNLLANFMDLVTAVKLATRRIITAEIRESCRSYMHHYLTTLLELFPGATIRPNQHMLLHLPDILQTLGPAPSIWCFGFERANYILQQTPTNNRMDDLSSTLLTRFCCKQALRNLFTSVVLPPSVRQLIPNFVHSFQSDTRGTLLTDILALGPPESQPENPSFDGHARLRMSEYSLLPDYIVDLLRNRMMMDYSLAGIESWTGSINPYVVSLDSVEYRGVLYKVSTCSLGDSNVIFTSQLRGQWRAGQVAHMFRYKQIHGECKFVQDYLVVKEFVPLTSEDSRLDPYRRFPVAGGRLFRDAFKPEIQLLTTKDLLCHFAMLPRLLPKGSVKCIHVLPLDKW